MKTVAALTILAGSAAAFAPAQTSTANSQLSYAKELDGMVGITLETGGKVFDPLNLSDYVPTDWAREAEIANGRSAMLATVGWVFPKLFGTFDSTDVTTTDPIDAILQASPQWWAQFVIACGTFEAFKYKQSLEGKSYLGEGAPVADYLKGWPEDAAGQEKLRNQELKNGRLAMIGFAGFLANHLIPGSCPVPDFA